MRKLFLLTLNALFLSNMACGQTGKNIVVINPLPVEREPYVKDTVYSELIKQSEYFEISITNTLTDTVYLFDSYLLDDFVSSKYLHRIDNTKKTHKISFAPIIPYLSVEKSDVVVLGMERIARRNQVLYSFKAIPPKTYLRIKINHNIFDNDEVISDFDAKKLSKFDNPVFNAVKTSNTRCFSNLIEFAVYKDISLLSNKKAYYLDEFNFDRQAQSFIILTSLIKE